VCERSHCRRTPTLSIKEATRFLKKSKNSWLISRHVYAIENIKKLSPKLLLENGAQGSPWYFSALSSPYKDISTIEWDLREIRSFNHKWQESSLKFFVNSYEVKIPEMPFHDFQKVVDKTSSLMGDNFSVYFEVPLEKEWKEALLFYADILSQSEKRMGLKIRTGGETKASLEQLAYFVHITTTHGLKFKATQGLHHAFTDKKEFGFVNLFFALSFAQYFGKEKFTLKNIEDCLSDTDSKKFKISENKIAWESFELTSEQIENARRVHCGCFGSCSAEEPSEEIAKCV
jgi:hypothetical protein